jgi:hypothetical protein
VKKIEVAQLTFLFFVDIDLPILGEFISYALEQVDAAAAGFDELTARRLEIDL